MTHAHHQSIVAERQEPLRQGYQQGTADPGILDGARALFERRDDPLRARVLPNNFEGPPLPLGIHRALGGYHQRANPGDLLCAALAGCLHLTTRMIADRLGIALADLEVTVHAQADARGSLLVDPEVLVRFQRMRCDVHLRILGDPGAGRLRVLTQMAERCCVVLRTLEGGTEVVTDWDIAQDIALPGDGSE